MDQAPGPDRDQDQSGAVAPPLDAEIVSTAALADAPPPLDDDEDVVDAEIVEIPSLSPYPSMPAPDYSEAGVPSLDYVRDKIQGRLATAAGSAELAAAEAEREAAARAAAEQQAAITAEQQRAAREQAGRAKLEEIRRQLHPET
ncbi:hypothetical protein SAMN04515671_2010 [Nakamurella panacisegetis]|uniref:Uncharacterized protein n=1 Tax=Nakamurella panacisegetis TaxID=1090615 RepID=A0A1H0MGV0_9ACTN|nr:hypothetical protein [Nakamurella panacisegetis]SDO79584.1 hypothetical protein SAMN04515671_2010 [Nakamurella panacisegetis]